MKKRLSCWLVAICCIAADEAYAVGERILDAVMRSDFVFDRNLSNVPFFPLGYVVGTYQDSLTLSECHQPECDVNYASLSEGAGLPVWVGQKNMLILGQSLEFDRLKSESGNVNDVNTVGALAAWISQPSTKIQAGGFYYYYTGFDITDGGTHPRGNMSGAVVRIRHRPTFHSYWGVIRLDDQMSVDFYPYAGFDWYIGQKWSVSMVLPWPSIGYAPDPNTLYKIGALYSGSDWLIQGEEEVQLRSISKIDAGFSYEKRIHGMIWGEIGMGLSGFGRFTIKSNAEVEYKNDIDSSPFVKISLNLRPE